MPVWGNRQSQWGKGQLRLIPREALLGASAKEGGARKLAPPFSLTGARGWCRPLQQVVEVDPEPILQPIEQLRVDLAHARLREAQ